MAPVPASRAGSTRCALLIQGSLEPASLCRTRPPLSPWRARPPQTPCAKPPSEGDQPRTGQSGSGASRRRVSCLAPGSQLAVQGPAGWPSVRTPAGGPSGSRSPLRTALGQTHPRRTDARLASRDQFRRRHWRVPGSRRRVGREPRWTLAIKLPRSRRRRLRSVTGVGHYSSPVCGVAVESSDSLDSFGLRRNQEPIAPATPDAAPAAA